MRTSLLAAASMLLPAVFLVISCGGPPKQAEAPDVDKGSGVDMAGEDPSAPKADDGSVKQSEAEMHTKCCQLCKDGMAKDRTGQSADKIPCADFTDTLTPWCLEHFRGKPTTASQCK